MTENLVNEIPATADTAPTTTLSAELASGALSASFTATTHMPGTGEVASAVLHYGATAEIIEITGNGSGNPYTVARAQESTSQATWPAGTQVNVVLTADSLADLIDERADARIAADTTKQAADPDLATIATIDSSTAGALVTDGAGWIRKTYAQLKTALSLSKSDVGLGNVDNTSDADKPVSSATQTALDDKADDALVLHTTGDESKAGELELTGALAIAGAMKLTGVNIDANAEQTLTLAAAVTSTSSTTWTVTQGSIDTLISLGLPLIARMAAGEQITIRSLNDATNQITVVRRKFGTTASTYANGSTFVTEMDSNYLVRADASALVNIVAYTGPNIYLPPTTTTEVNISPPDDGAVFIFTDAAGIAADIRVYGSGTAAEPGYSLVGMNKLFGACVVRYSAATELYTVIAQNVLTQRYDLDLAEYVGYVEYQGSVGDPNGQVNGNIGDIYVDKGGGVGATGWMNVDGGTTWANYA